MEPYASKPSAPSHRNPASVSSLLASLNRSNSVSGAKTFGSSDATYPAGYRTMPIWNPISLARQSSLWCGVIATSSGETPVAIASAARIARSYPCLQGSFSS